ncbi:TcpE family conjugal transfer membrane protein [Nonomuraea cavernae]|uniref:TcpE family conjugal transfer membrane protein n=1 Tax=Nonomuraea cavernae TaxID=2045107 RepID=UPI0033C04928
MDLPTYTNIWRIEKRLYKLYDLRLPMPLPIVWIGVFVGVFVPWSLLLFLVGVPVAMPWHVLYLVPPGIVTWLSTRPVIEGKRLTELLESQLRYLGQPRAWYRLAPATESETITFSGRVWHTMPARVRVKKRRKVRQPKRSAQRASGPRQVRPAVAAAAAAAAQAPLAEPASGRSGWGSASRRGTAPALSQELHAVRGEVVTKDAAPMRWGELPVSTDSPAVTQALDAGPGSSPATELSPTGTSSVRGDAPGATQPAEGGLGGSGMAEGRKRAEARERSGPTVGKSIDTEALRRLRRLAATADAQPSTPSTPSTSAGPASRRSAAAGSASDEPASDEPVSGESVSDESVTDGSVSGEYAVGGSTSVDSATAGSAPVEAVAGEAGAAESVAGVTRSGGAATDGAASDELAPGGATAGGTVPGAAVGGGGVAAGGAAAGEVGTEDASVSGGEIGDSATADEVRAGRGQSGEVTADESAAERLRGPQEVTGEGGSTKAATGAGAADVAGSEAARAEEASGSAREAGADRSMDRDAGRDEDERPREDEVARMQHRKGQPPRQVPSLDARRSRPSAGQVARRDQGAGAPPRRAGEGVSAGARRDEDTRRNDVAPAAREGGVRRGEGGADDGATRRNEGVAASVVREGGTGPRPVVTGPRETRVRRVESVVGRDSGGWRRIAQVVVGGGGVRSDGSEIDEARARGVFSGSRRIVVLGCTGGAGQSTTALMLGHALATYRDDKVIAVDANTGGNTLTSRIAPETPETLTSLLAGMHQVSGYLTMRGYTTRTASGLEVIGADSDAEAEQRLTDRTLFSDHRLGQVMHLLDRHYKLAVIDPAAALAARVLPYADQLVLVVPASEEAPEAVAMTYEWLDGHGCADLRRRAVMVVNGVSRRSMADVEQAESVASGRCRAIVRVPWEDDLAPGGADVVDPGQLRAAGRRAYLALAGVVVAGVTAQAVRPSKEELASDPPGTRIGER